MNPEYIKSLLKTAIDDVADNISAYSVHPKRDFTRTKKLPVNKLMLFLITEGSSSTKNELTDFFSFDDNLPSNSAFNQWRAKQKPEQPMFLSETEGIVLIIIWLTLSKKSVFSL